MSECCVLPFQARENSDVDVNVRNTETRQETFLTGLLRNRRYDLIKRRRHEQAGKVESLCGSARETRTRQAVAITNRSACTSENHR